MDCFINFAGSSNTEGIQWELQVFDMGSGEYVHDASGIIAAPDLAGSIVLPEDYDPVTQCYLLRWRRLCNGIYNDWTNKYYGEGDCDYPPSGATSVFTYSVFPQFGAWQVHEITIDGTSFPNPGSQGTLPITVGTHTISITVTAAGTQTRVRMQDNGTHGPGNNYCQNFTNPVNHTYTFPNVVVTEAYNPSIPGTWVWVRLDENQPC